MGHLLRGFMNGFCPPSAFGIAGTVNEQFTLSDDDRQDVVQLVGEWTLTGDGQFRFLLPICFGVLQKFYQQRYT